MISSKLSNKIQLKIYELNKQGLKPYSIATELKLELHTVKQCIKSMGIQSADLASVDDPRHIYDFLNQHAVNISKTDAERKTVILFKISYDEFNYHYTKWRQSYLQDFSRKIPIPVEEKKNNDYDDDYNDLEDELL